MFRCDGCSFQLKQLKNIFTNITPFGHTSIFQIARRLVPEVWLNIRGSGMTGQIFENLLKLLKVSVKVCKSPLHILNNSYHPSPIVLVKFDEGYEDQHKAKRKIKKRSAAVYEELRIGREICVLGRIFMDLFGCSNIANECSR